MKNFDPVQRRHAGNILKFLAALLAFTLIARGTSGATLARVTVTTPERSEIVDAISGTATVSSTDTIEITVPQGLTITEMLVNVGQNIEPGDAVVLFAKGDLQEQLIREEASLNRMNLDLERLERGELIDVSSLESAQRSLRRAQEDYTSTVRQGEADVNEARDALTALIEDTYGTEAEMLPSAIRSHQRALEDYYATLAQGEADIAAAEEALQAVDVDDTALQTAIRNHQRALDDYNSTRAQGQAAITDARNELNAQRNRPSTDRTTLDNAQRSHQRAVDDFNTTRQQGEAAVNAAQATLDAAIAASAPPAEIEQAQAALTTAQNTASTNLLAAQRRVEDAWASLDQAQRAFNSTTQGDLDRAETTLENAQAQAASNLLAAERRLEDAEISLEQAQRSFDNSVQAETERLENALENAQARAADNQLAAARRLEDASGSVNSEVERAQAAVQTAINRADDNRQQAARRVEDAAASLNNAQQNHERTVQQSADTTAQNVINATTLLLDIEAQRETVQTLETIIANDGVLYAEHAGAVSFTKQVGSETDRTPVVTLRNTDGGFEAQMQISRSDAERLTVGSESEVTTGGGSIFFTPTVTGIVSGISGADENDRVTITIALPDGDWAAGQRVDAQIILNRANFDLSVPISALHSDNSGYFVHVMEHRSTVLGLQNVVVRVNVTIVASDNDMVSVRGIGHGSLVIVSSNKAISVGDRIRVA